MNLTNFMNLAISCSCIVHEQFMIISLGRLPRCIPGSGAVAPVYTRVWGGCPGVYPGLGRLPRCIPGSGAVAPVYTRVWGGCPGVYPGLGRLPRCIPGSGAVAPGQLPRCIPRFSQSNSTCD